MFVEDTTEDIINFLHIDAFSNTVPLWIDLDVQLTFLMMCLNIDQSTTAQPTGATAVFQRVGCRMRNISLQIWPMTGITGLWESGSWIGSSNLHTGSNSR